MSRPLAPRFLPGGAGPETPQAIQRSRKISTACSACKQRKTRCTGETPCEACAMRNSQCLYDITADQRRKIANQKNVQDLAQAQHELEKLRQLLGGIIATVRTGDAQSTSELLGLIRTGVDLSQLAAHVRNECRSNLDIQNTYDSIDFFIDGEEHLPSPNQILRRPLTSELQSFIDMPPNSGSPQPFGTEYGLYEVDETHGEST